MVCGLRGNGRVLRAWLHAFFWLGCVVFLFCFWEAGMRGLGLYARGLDLVYGCMSASSFSLLYGRKEKMEGGEFAWVESAG